MIKEVQSEEIVTFTTYTRPIYLTSPQMYGEDVKDVQRRLNELNYNSGTVDGYFGPSGDKAVRVFQGKNGLSVDGLVGPTTWNKLFSSSAIPNTDSEYKRPIYLTNPQMYGEDVKYVQRRLNELKYNAGTVDGYFGPSGDKAVRAFQGKNGLSVDGSVGPTTWNKLFSSSAIPNTDDGGNIGIPKITNAHGTFSMPTYGKVTAGYPYYNSGGKHNGVDIANSSGTPIYAMRAGTVVKSGFYSGGGMETYGNVIFIDHGNGIQTRYAHNSQLIVKVGNVVSEGQLIAKMGTTGNSTGNHLHFEVLKDGVRTHPAPSLKYGDTVSYFAPRIID
ncbi:MAG: peptidoglycan-binding protein [Romboutsia sp.]